MGKSIYYEVCKAGRSGDADIYTTLAWTDVRTYARDCADGKPVYVA